MPSKCCSTIGGALAIIGVATMVGAAHSLATPVKVKRNASADPVQEPGAEQPEGQTQIGVVTGENDAPELATHREGEIDLAGAKAHFDNFGVFLDARTVGEYENGHIPNALWMPVDRLLGNGALVFEIDDEAGGMDQPIVIYCGGGDCDASHNLAIVLEDAGFTNLLVFVEGYPAWVDAGYEVDLGAPMEYEP